MRLSIITISYNQVRYLPAVFDSLGRQLMEGDEHIVVDPGSSDGSQELIKQRALLDPRIRPVFESDEGPADGLNKGFRIAKGEICSYINADDWVLPGSLAYVRSCFKRNLNLDVLIGAVKMANASGSLSWRGRVADDPTPRRLSAGLCQYYQQGTYFRREMYQRISGFNAANRTCWDRELIVDMALAGARFLITSRPLGVFRIHGQSITGAGTNRAAYLADNLRIKTKAQAKWPVSESGITLWWLKTEARLNPLRWLRQLRPVVRDKS